MPVNHKKSPSLPPPASEVGIVVWVKKNLFSTYANGVMSLAAIVLILLLLPPLLDWAFFSATWSGSNRADCNEDGACWIFIANRIDQVFSFAIRLNWEFSF